MYVFLQTAQAPLQSGWYDSGSYILGFYATGSGVNQIIHMTNYTNAVGGAYISPQATSAIGNIFYNNRGAITYSCVKTGGTTGTLTATPFQDAQGILVAAPVTYTLTVTDAGTGQRYTSARICSFGA